MPQAAHLFLLAPMGERDNVFNQAFVSLSLALLLYRVGVGVGEIRALFRAFCVITHILNPANQECGTKADTPQKPEDHWSCIAHLIAEDMLKSAVTEEKTFKHSPWAGADIRAKILMSTGRPHHYGHLLQVYNESLQPLTLYTSFHDLINVYSRRSGARQPQGTKF